MRLLSFGTTQSALIVSLSSLGSLVEAVSVGDLSARDSLTSDPALASRQLSGGANRKVTIVTDVLPTDGKPQNASGTPELVLPSHSWAIFGQTSTDSALRVELVRPIVGGQISGPAISVIDHLGMDFDAGQLGSNRTERRTHTFECGHPLTNDQIFDPGFRSAQPSANPAPKAMSYVSRVWLQNAGLVDNSHQFVQLLLVALELRTDGVAVAEAQGDLYADGMAWIRESRAKPANAMQPIRPPGRVENLYYEALQRGPDPSGAPQLFQGVYQFGNAPDGHATIGPYRVDLPWPADLSRDPRAEVW